jgi:aerobic carbon-monoxide dehydrogenase medium subunit
MKPARFEYLAPATVEEALEMLAQGHGEASVLAGGQSLVPAMNFRLATPSALVDLNCVSGLDHVYVDEDYLVVESLVRHHTLEKPVIRDAVGSLMARMSKFVGHLPIRVRGTFVGSIAHADPAAEWCLLAAALGATIVAQSLSGERRIAAADFLEGPFTTALASDELITSVRLPLLGGAGTSFHEVSRTAGDFAAVAAISAVRIENGAVVEAHLGIGGAEGRPARCNEAEEALLGKAPEPDAIASVARIAADNVEPISDAFCSADYRRHLVEVLMARTVREATAEAVA